MKGGGGTYRRYSEPIGKGALPKGNEKQDICSTINLSTNIQKLSVGHDKYHKGDILEVVLDEKENISIIGDKGLLGYITPIQSSTIISCIKKGNFFEARIIDIEADYCRVKIQPSS